MENLTDKELVDLNNRVNDELYKRTKSMEIILYKNKKIGMDGIVEMYINQLYPKFKQKYKDGPWRTDARIIGMLKDRFYHHEYVHIYKIETIKQPLGKIRLIIDIGGFSEEVYFIDKHEFKEDYVELMTY